MSKDTFVTLDDAVSAARKLPSDAQAAIARELMEQVEDFSTPERSAERQKIIKDRLSKPLRAISRDELTAMLRRYNPAI
ncbi:MAG: hypothetical protein COW30_03940 [Rhodospirillales bacterium CG15_BIG_FIL_POST_REV_8_21_14_020_66_15]|nr:MAG: hypothetical protein COW30_03940 [Rhodospirillales bacterium CG15_BIG_FIL_POST_REV_8_21_14_020_66_15]